MAFQLNVSSLFGCVQVGCCLLLGVLDGGSTPPGLEASTAAHGGNCPHEGRPNDSNNRTVVFPDVGQWQQTAVKPAVQ